MTQSQLIDHLMDQMPNFSRKQVEAIVHALFEGIASTLAEGGRVELRGFGSFFVKHRRPRMGCDPRTGDPIQLDDRYIPFFRAGKVLLESLNS